MQLAYLSWTGKVFGAAKSSTEDPNNRVFLLLLQTSADSCDAVLSTAVLTNDEPRDALALRVWIQADKYIWVSIFLGISFTRISSFTGSFLWDLML